MSPEMVVAVTAGVTLLILWSATVFKASSWITSLVKNTKDEILEDFSKKHEENARTVKALETLVIRHDVILNAEFGSLRPNGQAQRQR